MSEEFRMTDEMVDYFYNRTMDHIKRVINYARKLNDLRYLCDNGFKEILNHDKSKFLEPEYTPYVKRTWQEKINKGTKNGDYHNMDDDVKAAIVHHVTNNDHHPEYWSKDYKGFESNDPCHINFMPDSCIIEMACDWKSMGDEFGNSATDWFYKTKNSRWIWDEKLEPVVLKWLDVIDHLDPDPE